MAIMIFSPKNATFINATNCRSAQLASSFRRSMLKTIELLDIAYTEHSDYVSLALVTYWHRIEMRFDWRIESPEAPGHTTEANKKQRRPIKLWQETETLHSLSELIH